MQNHKNLAKKSNAIKVALDRQICVKNGVGVTNLRGSQAISKYQNLSRGFATNSGKNLPCAQGQILLSIFEGAAAKKSLPNLAGKGTSPKKSVKIKISNLTPKKTTNLPQGIALKSSPENLQNQSVSSQSHFHKFTAERAQISSQVVSAEQNDELSRFGAQISPRSAATSQKSQTRVSSTKPQNLNKPQPKTAAGNDRRILNEAQVKNSSQNPSQSQKGGANLLASNSAKSSSFTTGLNLTQSANQTDQGHADQTPLNTKQAASEADVAASNSADQDALLAEFKAFLNAHLPSNPSFHPCFDEALSYTLKSGGKHFRAMLVAGVVAAVRPERKEAAFHVALAFETMHSYSLIHDDLPAMDDSDLRRGRPSLHVKFDEVTAILAGDALNTHAFYQITKAPLDADARIKCVEILSRNAGIYGMALGQALDCYFENRKLGLEELKFLHIHKTARLIAASLQAGCVVAGLAETQTMRIYDIGLDLGLAFQITDDIIDATQSAETAGKPTHNDAAKNSFTNLLGVEGAARAKNELIAKIERELNGVHAGIRAVVTGLIDKHLR